MKKSKEAYKTIKRPFKFRNIDETVINKLNDVIERTNLFITNIYNFVKTYYILTKTNETLTKDKLYEIFLILKKDNQYENKHSDYYKFYVNKFKQIYLNPINKDNVLDGSYLDQVMKNNLSFVLSSIENNIIFNHEKYLNRFIKNYMINLCKDELEYNSLIKKCSVYESCKDISTKIINKLKNQNEFKIEILQKLLSEIKTYEKIKCIKRSKDNIFSDKIKEIKDYENEFNKIKSNIKKILTNEKVKDKLYDKSIIPIKFQGILNLKENINPIGINEYNDELSKNKYKFIQSLIYMNNYFEENNIKTFCVFPSRSNVIPKYITLDTASVSVIFCNNQYQTIEKYKKEIYQRVFKFHNSYFELNKNYVFSGTIQTDGVSLSLLYLHINDYENKVKINKKKHKAKNEEFEYKKEIKECKSIITKYKNEIKKLSKKTNENKEEISNLDKKINKIENKILDIQKYQEKQKKEKESKKKEYEKQKKVKDRNEKKKYIEYIQKLNDENKVDELKIINRKNKEFYYLTDLTKAELKELNISKILYIDQGKVELIYVLNGGNEKYMHYSGKERGKVIKTKMHMENINNILKSKGIEKENDTLKELNKKSTNYKSIIETISKINEINYKVYEDCKEKKLRKEKLEMYIDKQKAESYMMKKFVKQLGIKDLEELKEYTIVIGDWKGNNNLKNNKSTLGIGMKRILRKYVKNLYLLDEYNTSKISNVNYTMFGEKDKESYYLCKEHKMELISVCKNTGEQKVINKQMHGILTYKTDKINIPCANLLYKTNENENADGTILRLIQRDKNAVLNFKTIVEFLLKNKEIPLAFKRNNSWK